MADETSNNHCPASVACQTAKYTSPTKSSLGPMDEFSSECLYSELSEQNCTKASSCVNEYFQPFNDVTKNSLTEQLGSPSEVLINDNHDSLAQDLGLALDDVNMITQAENSGCLQGMEHIHELTERGSQHIFEFVQNQPVQTNSVLTSSFVNGQPQPISESMTAKFTNVELGMPSVYMCKNGQMENEKQPEVPHKIMKQTYEIGFGGVLAKVPEQNHQCESELAQKDPAEGNNGVVGDIAPEGFGPSFEETECSLNEHLGHPFGETASPDKQLEPLSEVVPQKSSTVKLETPPTNAVKTSKQFACREKRTLTSRKKKYMLRSLVGSDRVLRSRTRVKAEAPEPSNNLNDVIRGEQRRKKKTREKVKIVDEFSRIRNHLRYFLNRMAYEQSLIEAYSGEGWKGYSSEKLKPEKELQRASLEILRRKLHIRELFQRLDSLCAEGRLPESLFDSEGEICSEDIYCSKCGSKELSANNDIILCDGACDRGFHQLCVKPPLLNEDIPPDDEGWLCPGCDCKVDCIDLLNESQGTNLSITDNWEKVYPEAAGQNQDNTLGLPSDDSDDDDYDPGSPEIVEQGEPSSGGSKYNSASKKLEASTNDNQYLNLPSDDSEDDSYDPSALDVDEKVKSESSSSDFTSDFEDLAAIVDDNRPTRNNNGSVSSSPKDMKPLRGYEGSSFKHGQRKHSLEDELTSILDSGPSQDGFAPGKRHVDRLDYKKLHDETYGKVSSDSSDDEDWNDSAAKRRRSLGKVAPMSHSKSSTIKNEDIAQDIKHDLKEIENSKRKPRRKPTHVEANDSSTRSLEEPSKSGSTGKRARPSAHKKLDEAVLQRLQSSFKENQYPDKATKENLAQELGITLKQVSKWFENTRWSTRHPSCRKANTDGNASQKGNPRLQSTTKSLERELNECIKDATLHVEPPATSNAVPQCQTGDMKYGKQVTHGTGQESATIKTRKRKGKSDNLATNLNETAETQKAPDGSSKVNEVKTFDRMKTRMRKSVG